MRFYDPSANVDSIDGPTVPAEGVTLMGGLVCRVGQMFEAKWAGALTEMVGGDDSQWECFARAMAWVEGSAQGWHMMARGGMKGMVIPAAKK